MLYHRLTKALVLKPILAIGLLDGGNLSQIFHKEFLEMDRNGQREGDFRKAQSQSAEIVVVVSTFGMQGSLVQIQSSRPVEFVEGPAAAGSFFSRNEPRADLAPLLTEYLRHLIGINNLGG